MKLYYVEDAYIQQLRSIDSRVPFNKQATRPYVGIVLTIGKHHYFAPLSSPKEKFLKMKPQVDFHKIQNGTLGVLNLNNMIPVLTQYLIPIDLENTGDSLYQNLLNKQLEILKVDKRVIQEKAQKLYQLICDSTVQNNYMTKLKSRCVDFKRLENYISKN